MRRDRRRSVTIWALLSGMMDWFLVLVGAVFLYWALLSVDVAGARWAIGTAGAILVAVGLLCRYRHWRRHRQEEER